MLEHVQIHAPHEVSELREAVSRRVRLLEIVAAFIPSLATLGITWSGYQAAKWTGIRRRLR